MKRSIFKNKNHYTNEVDITSSGEQIVKDVEGKNKKYLKSYDNPKKLINWFCLSGPVSVLFYALHDIIGGWNYPGYDWKSQAVSDLTATDAPCYAIAHGLSSSYGTFNCLCCALLCILVNTNTGGLNHRDSTTRSNDTIDIDVVEEEDQDQDEDQDHDHDHDHDHDQNQNQNTNINTNIDSNKNGNGKKNGNKNKNKPSRLLELGIYIFTLMNYVSALGYSLFPLSSAGYDGSFQSFIHVYVVTIAVVLLSILSLILIAVGSFRGLVKYKWLGTLAIVALLLMCLGAIGSGLVPKSCFGIVERFSTYSAVVFTGILGCYGFNNLF